MSCSSSAVPAKTGSGVSIKRNANKLELLWREETAWLNVCVKCFRILCDLGTIVDTIIDVLFEWEPRLIPAQGFASAGLGCQNFTQFSALPGMDRMPWE